MTLSHIIHKNIEEILVLRQELIAKTSSQKPTVYLYRNIVFVLMKGLRNFVKG